MGSSYFLLLSSEKTPIFATKNTLTKFQGNPTSGLHTLTSDFCRGGRGGRRRGGRATLLANHDIYIYIYI